MSDGRIRLADEVFLSDIRGEFITDVTSLRPLILSHLKTAGNFCTVQTFLMPRPDRNVFFVLLIHNGDDEPTAQKAFDSKYRMN